jgi:hypothetical protein
MSFLRFGLGLFGWFAVMLVAMPVTLIAAAFAHAADWLDDLASSFLEW